MEERKSELVRYGNVKKIALSGMYENTNIEGYAEIRYNDECGNKHNSFGITGTWYLKGKVHNDRNMYSCGCTHDIILKLSKNTDHEEFLKDAIKFHMVSSDSPIHYFANTMYHATNKDNGYLKGEPNTWEEKLKIEGYPFSIKMDKVLREFLKSDNFNKDELEIIAIEHKKDDYPYSDNYCFKSMDITEWHKCPFRTKDEAQEYKIAFSTCKWYIEKVITGYSKGKERDLQAARNSAIWENATIEQLESKEELEKHLIDVMEEFYNFITIDCNFIY